MFGLYEDFRSTPREGCRIPKSGLGHFIWIGPKVNEIKEERVLSFSFPFIVVWSSLYLVATFISVFIINI